jgi:hypothetical protein
MGILVNQGARGNLFYEKDKAIFKGVNSKGTNVKIDITGGFKDGKATPLDVEKFKQGFRNLITQSANLSIEKTTSDSKKKQIQKELKERLKMFEKGNEISINIDEAMGIFIPDKDTLVMSAVGTPQSTKQGRVFHNIKPIEDEKLNKSHIPVKTTVRAMVMKRESFNKLSDEDKRAIKYEKGSADAGNWKWKKVSISDLERGNVDLLTVQMEGTLIKSFSKPNDMISILSKDEAYLDYMTSQKGKNLRGSHIIVEDHEKEKVAVPRTSIFVPEHRILAESECENIRELLKKIFEKANKNASKDNRFYIPFESESNSLKIDETNIENIKSARIVKDAFKTILSQFEYKYADMIKFAGVKDPESQTMQYIQVTDSIHTAKNRKDFVSATKQLYKMVERDGLNNAPITVSFRMSTDNYLLKDNHKYQEKQKEAIRELLGQMSKDMTTPLEKVFIRQLMTDSNSKYIQKIKENVAKAVSIDAEKKTISYSQDNNNFTLKDKMFIEVNGRVLNSDGFIAEDGKKIPSTGFTALKVTVNGDKEKDNFVGLSGVGGRKFEYLKSTAILSSMGMAYVAHPLKNLQVNKDNIPTLQKNPITGEETNVTVKIHDEKVPTKEIPSQTPIEVASEMPKGEEDGAIESVLTGGLFESTEEQEQSTSELAVAKDEDIKDEMAMSLGDGIDMDDLAGFLDDDEEIDVQRANEVEQSQPKDGVSNLAP